MNNTDLTAPTAWFSYLAALWDDRPERLAAVTEQIRAIHAKLCEWRMNPSDRDELDYATTCYARVCASYECVQWLPFDLMPNWEDDLYCVLMDEDRWQEYRDANRPTWELATALRDEASTQNV